MIKGVPNVNTGPVIKSKGLSIEDRAEYQALAREDEAFREDFNALCALDCVFFANTCVWIFEPRGESDERDIPLILRPFQEDYIEDLDKCIEEGRDAFIEKTREMGVTWCTLIVLFHRWLFETAFTAKVGSYNRDMVDRKDDEDSLFAKLDYLVESLRWDVPWLYPPGYRPMKPTRTFMKMYNPWSRGIITGQAPTERFGRGGRQKCIYLDEFQEWPHQERSWTSCSKTTNCRIISGTPNGPHNLFARLAHPEKMRKGKEDTIHLADTSRKPRKKISLHWLLDPTKNHYELRDRLGRMVGSGHGVPKVVPIGFKPVYPWYEMQKELFDYDITKMAQEIDIDYNRSTQGAMYPVIEKCEMLDFIPFQPDLELYCAIDFGVEDATSIGWFQFNQFNFRWFMIDYYEANGKSIYFYIPIIRGDKIQVGMSMGEEYTDSDLEVIYRHRGWFPYYTGFFGDPSGINRNPVTATSVTKALRDHDIFVTTNQKARGFEERYNAARHFLPRLSINMELCSQFVEFIRASRWQPRGEQDSATSPRKPVHDRTSHARSMLEYMAVNNPYANDVPLEPGNLPKRLGMKPTEKPQIGMFGSLATLREALWGRRKEEGGYEERDFSGY